MYHKKTIFILGAGASAHYGYPLGKDLIPLMIDSLRDKIPIPVLPNSPAYYNETDERHGRLYDYEQTKKFILGFKEHELQQFSASPRGNQRYHLVTQGGVVGAFYPMEFYHTPIGRLDKFNELEKRLRISNPTSIDAFLRNNPDLNEVAKILIIYTLLKCENSDIFNSDAQGDAWHPVLFNELTQGCSRPESVLENNINFINFNYDASLEYFFRLIFKETQLFSGSANELIDFFQTRTHHVYGHLPTSLHLQDYGRYSKSNIIVNPETTSFFRFLRSLHGYAEILTIHEERANKNHEQIRGLIKEAEVINIIGFAFDRDNLNVLGFPDSISGWNNYAMELRKPQKINYLNFNGDNTKLESEFARISQSGPSKSLSAHESKATRITDALLYDFKSFLFDD